MRAVAGATTLGNYASTFGVPVEEAAIVAELKAGSEQAYAWLIGQYQQPVYGLVYRIVSDPADAADTTQEVFFKVFRGIKHFNGGSSLKTWLYRIAVHEASNRRRWWFRHRSRETSIEPEPDGDLPALKDLLVDQRESPMQCLVQHQLQALVASELRRVAEPYRSAVVLRDLEELSYEEIADIMQVSLGTVKSRLTRGREALKERLKRHLHEIGPELGFAGSGARHRPAAKKAAAASGQEVEVTT